MVAQQRARRVQVQVQPHLQGAVAAAESERWGQSAAAEWLKAAALSPQQPGVEEPCAAVAMQQGDVGVLQNQSMREETASSQVAWGARVTTTLKIVSVSQRHQGVLLLASPQGVTAPPVAM